MSRHASCLGGTATICHPSGRQRQGQKGVVGSDSMLPCWTFTTKYSASLKKYDAGFHFGLPLDGQYVEHTCKYSALQTICKHKNCQDHALFEQRFC